MLHYKTVRYPSLFKYKIVFLITKIIADSGYICHIFINTVNDPRTNLQLLLAKNNPVFEG